MNTKSVTNRGVGYFRRELPAAPTRSSTPVMRYGTTPVRSRYGAQETNGIADPNQWGEFLASVDQTRRLEDRDLVKITRLRLITEPGYPYYDISYCYGELADGTPVRVQLDETHLKRTGLKRDLIAMAKRARRFGKGMGLLDENNWSVMTG